jgi:hypothetical protein
MNRLARCLVATGVLLALAAHARAALPPTLRVCGDVNEFPPFSYHQRVDGKKSLTVAGFDLMNIPEFEKIKPDWVKPID